MGSRHPESLGQRIVDLRTRRDWLQSELAKRAAVSQAFLSGVERDQRTPGSEVLLRIADALSTSLDYLMKGDGGEAPQQSADIISPALAKAATNEGWTYEETVALWQAGGLTKARRSPSGQRARPPEEWSTSEWREFHGRLFQDG